MEPFRRMNILIASLIIYIVGLVVWIAGRAITGDQSIYILALNYLGVWLFLPLLFYIPWVLLNRYKLGAFLLVFPIVLFIWFYGSMFIPRRAQAVNTQVPITVMTHNLQCSNTDVKSLIAVLDAHPVEVLVLQEYVQSHEEELREVLAERYVYHSAYTPAGLAIYSQHPILNQEIYPAQPWSIQSIVIQVHEAPVHLINAHLAKPGILQVFETREIDQIRQLAAARSAQITQIKNAIRAIGLPVIVACDCNMTELTSSYVQITNDLLDAYKERSWGLGHTFLMPRGFEIRTGINLPVQRIDYFFHSPEIRVNQIQVIREDTGSDHRPLWAQFDLKP